jgi:phosphoglycerate kinase
VVKKTIDDLAVAGRVVVRADLNVPLDGPGVADDGQIRAALAALAALTALLDRDAQVIVCAHPGRLTPAVDRRRIR